MARHHIWPAGAVALLIAACGDSTGPEPQFQWSERIDQGERIEILGVNGPIDAVWTSGDQVVVTAYKTGQHDDPDLVEIEVVPHAGGVTICAVYPDATGFPPNECLPGDQGHLSAQDNDVEVEFVVSVPSGVVFVGTTINGDVTADDLQSNAFLTTVNGDATVSTTRLAEAATVNGQIHAVVGLSTWDRDLDFVAVNGNVTVEIPETANAVVQLRTTNGTISSDFPLTELFPGNVQGTIGDGGRRLSATTVNGNVALRGSS